MPAERVEPSPFPGLSNVTRLGMGGMGTVFSARQDDLGRQVAVKTLRAELTQSQALREQFTREAHILAQLDHPGIVSVHYSGESEEGPYYVMRLIDGESVDRHLQHAEAVEVAAVFQDIAAALAAAHAESVLHRDVKPANIVVEASGRPILVDFGLSTIALQGAEESAGESLVGTPDYLAPELLEGAGYSEASDVYALGATLYFVLTGRVPFPADDLIEKLRAIREEDPPAPRALCQDVPKPLQAVCLKAMERSPEDRYTSAAEFQRDLGRFLEGNPVQALPVRSRSLLRRKLARHLEDHAEWEEQGLLDERQRSALQYSYEKLDEEERGLMRGVLTSVPNLLLLAGLILTVFGPILLQLIAWDDLGAFGRLALPVAPLVLLATLGSLRWRTLDRRRGLACLLGASLLAFPAAFGLWDLVPALQTVLDAEGHSHPVLPEAFWFPPLDSPAWVHAGARLLAWKVLLASAFVLAVLLTMYSRTRAAVFLWLLGLTIAGAGISAAQLAGWRDLPLEARWLLESAGALAVIAAGIPLDRNWRRDRALPFYGIGFVWLLATVLTYAPHGLPVSLLGLDDLIDPSACALLTYGAGFVAAGLFAHHRGTPLQRQSAGVPLFGGFVLVYVGLSGLAMHNSWIWESLLVVDCVAFLIAGLALHRNSLVLPAAIALPLTVGSLSQRHMDALWAWSITIVLMGTALVLLALRLSKPKAADAITSDQARAPRREG